MYGIKLPVDKAGFGISKKQLPHTSRSNGLVEQETDRASNAERDSKLALV